MGTNVIDNLVGGFAGFESGNQYRTTSLSVLDKLDDIETATRDIVIKDKESYQKAQDLKGLLCGLSCFTSNNNHVENDRVWKLESIIGHKMFDWNKKNLAKGDENLLIRYLLWNYTFMSVTESKIRTKAMDILLEKGRIFIDSDNRYVVTGLYCKVGDNVFTISGNNRHHRTYVDVCMPQAFILKDKDAVYLETKDVPSLPAEYNVTYLRDGKGCAKTPSVKKKEYSTVFKYM